MPHAAVTTQAKHTSMTKHGGEKNIDTINDVRENVIACLEERLPDMEVIGEPLEPPEQYSNPVLATLLRTVVQTQLLGAYYGRTFSFELHYEAGSGGGSQAQLHAVAERLYDAASFIAVDDTQYRSSNLKHEIKEGRLHFAFELTLRMKRQEALREKMGSLEQEAGVK